MTIATQMVFEVRRDGCDVDIRITPFSHIAMYHVFHRKFANKIDAELWARTIREAMDHRIEVIRRGAYEAGVRDGRKRKDERVDLFSGCVNDDEPPQ